MIVKIKKNFNNVLKLPHNMYVNNIYANVRGFLKVVLHSETYRMLVVCNFRIPSSCVLGVKKCKKTPPLFAAFYN